jgi:hypothetical protein
VGAHADVGSVPVRAIGELAFENRWTGPALWLGAGAPICVLAAAVCLPCAPGVAVADLIGASVPLSQAELTSSAEQAPAPVAALLALDSLSLSGGTLAQFQSAVVEQLLAVEPRRKPDYLSHGADLERESIHDDIARHLRVRDPHRLPPAGNEQGADAKAKAAAQGAFNAKWGRAPPDPAHWGPRCVLDSLIERLATAQQARHAALAASLRKQCPDVAF